MQAKNLALAAVAAGIAMFAGTASAVTPDLTGYFRSGAGTSSQGGNIVCYRLPGSIVWFRLGNECDTYVALSLGAELAKVDGTAFKFKVTTAQGTQGLANWEQSSPALREVYVEATDLGAAMKMPALNGASLWAGKRYYKNPDIHMLDYTYWEPGQGPGFGLDNVSVGPGKLSYAMLRIGDFTGYGISTSLTGYNPDLIGGGTRTATVHDLRLEEIPVNPGGKATVGINLVRSNNRGGTSTYTKDETVLADLDNNPATPPVNVVVRNTYTIDNKPGKNGVGLTLTHDQADPFGTAGKNTVGLQFANNAVSLKGFGFAGSTEDRREWMLFDSWYVAPKGTALSATSTVGYRNSKINGSTVKETWIGTRPVYNLNNIWSVMAEIGHQQIQQDSQATRKLSKLTLGTQFSMGPGVWARPAIRFYTTYAKWNDAAAQAGTVACSGRDCNTAADGYAGKRSGVSYGVQVEAWF